MAVCVDFCIWVLLPVADTYVAAAWQGAEGHLFRVFATYKFLAGGSTGFAAYNRDFVNVHKVTAELEAKRDFMAVYRFAFTSVGRPEPEGPDQPVHSRDEVTAEAPELTGG